MTRVKRGLVSHAKHKKIFQANKGYRMTKRRLIKVATEANLHAGVYAYRGRKQRKRDFRREWISKINSALVSFDLTYSRFMNGLKKAKIELDRKTLSELIMTDPQAFKSIVDKVKSL